MQHALGALAQTAVVGHDQQRLALCNQVLEQGKDVFAVPGSIFSQYSAGPHGLLRQGAKLVDSAKDIVEEISSLADWVTRSRIEETEKKELSLLNSTEQEILTNLEKEPQGIHIDKLQLISNKTFGELSQILMSLELKKFIKSLPGKMYLKT